MQPRVISLLPCATEIVCALGLEAFLCGRSHECDFPPSVAALPACTESKLDAHGTSRQIQDRVSEILQSGLSIYRVFPESLRALQPTVLVTQVHCEVCAVSLREVEQAVCEALESRPAIVSLEPNRLADVWRDIVRVACALGVEERGRALVANLQARMMTVSQAALLRPQRPRVVTIEWIEPLMAAGNWVPELIEMAGGINLFGKAGEHSPWMNLDELLSADPDVVVVMPCGFDLLRTRREMAALESHPRWQELRAVRERRVYLTDGNQYFNRPGPRLVESLEVLAECLHPGAFDYGHRLNNRWEPFLRGGRIE